MSIPPARRDSQPQGADTFVAAGRAEHVKRLEVAFGRLIDESTAGPVLIVLEARSGYGKTRIVQEFYRRIAKEQSYWPASLVEPVGGLGAYEARKRIGFTRFEKKPSELPFMWLALDCELHGGRPVSGAVELRSALREHVPSGFSSGPGRRDVLRRRATWPSA
jgi:hypothetical protein